MKSKHGTSNARPPSRSSGVGGVRTSNAPVRAFSRASARSVAIAAARRVPRVRLPDQLGTTRPRLHDDARRRFSR